MILKPLALGGITVLVLATLTAAYFFFDVKGKPAPSMPAPSDPAASTTASVSANPGYTIEQVPLDENSVLLPDLDRPVVFLESIPPEVRTAIEKRAADLKAQLKKDPSNGAAWFDLALVYHQANDYEGAKAVWEFLTVVLPEDTTALDNLGKLYHFSLKNYPKAEEYFEQSITVDPDLTTPYFELFDLYRYSYKTDTRAAIDIITEAKKRFPGNVDPYLLLALYYRSHGDYAFARIEYEQAMDLARTAADIALIESIGNELSSLPTQAGLPQ